MLDLCSSAALPDNEPYRTRNTRPTGTKGRRAPAGIRMPWSRRMRTRSHQPSVISRIGPSWGKSSALSSRSLRRGAAPCRRGRECARARRSPPAPMYPESYASASQNTTRTTGTLAADGVADDGAQPLAAARSVLGGCWSLPERERALAVPSGSMSTGFPPSDVPAPPVLEAPGRPCAERSLEALRPLHPVLHRRVDPPLQMDYPIKVSVVAFRAVHDHHD